MGEEKAGAGPLYECVRCGRRVYLSELEKYVSFRCPECGYRIFKKVRPSIVKRVKAR
jgi:DNA-directed RNA polymerase subunit P